MGGSFGTSLTTACGPDCALDDRFVGDLAALEGYGKGVFSSGACVYDARYRRSVYGRMYMLAIGSRSERPSMMVADERNVAPWMYSITCPKLVTEGTSAVGVWRAD